MKLTQNWVGYLDRSYEQIKKSVLQRLVTKVPELTNHSESNPLIILVSIFAGIAEMLNMYIDKQAQEVYLSTARKYTSIIKLSKLIDYQVKAKSPSLADILFTIVDINNNPTTVNQPINIPIGTIITNTLNSLSFRLIHPITIPTGKSSVYTIATQDVIIDEIQIGTGLSMPNQSIQLPMDYEHKSLKIKIANEEWFGYVSFAYMDSTTKGFGVSIEEDGNCYIVFGDGFNGRMPESGTPIMATWRETAGTLGNSSPNSITKIENLPSLPPDISLIATNPNYSTGGTDFENLEQIRKNSPLSLRTMLRAVTAQDYEDIARLVQGVGDAKVKFCCGKYISIYITPNSPGVATLGLLDRVQQEFANKKMITTFVEAIVSGVSPLYIKGKIFGTPLTSITELNLQVAQALEDNFGYSATFINRRISVSEIIGLIETLPLVDYFNLEELKIIPFARAINHTLIPLDITFTNPQTTVIAHYEITYIGVDNFTLYKNGLFLATVHINTPYSDSGIIGFTINPGNYAVNNKWEFTVHPTYPEVFPETLIQISDLTAPYIEVSPFIDIQTPRTIFGDLSFHISETITSSLAPCE